jgi:hypothetical protein
MRQCNHSHWLALSSRNNETIFSVSDRATNLFRCLPNIQFQTPTLLVFIGNKSKTLALRELVLLNSKDKAAGKRRNGEIHLHTDPSSVFSDRPILIADSDFSLEARSVTPLSADDCHEVSSTVLPRLRSSVNETSTILKAADNLHLKLLSPFTDIFCFFAADLGGLHPIARRLASWLEIENPSTMPSATHAQVVIVVESSALEFRILEEFFQLLQQETDKDISTHFSNVRIVTLLPRGSISPQARHRRLKECLFNISDQVRLARIKSNTSFSAQHFLAFLGHACSHFGAGSSAPFDFIQKSRVNNPVAPDLKNHLVNFLSLIKGPDQLQELAAPLIASSIILDHYPPDMHRRFD